MTMGMSLTAFAVGEPETPKTGTVTIKNVVEDATIEAYQLVSYDASGKYNIAKVTNDDEEISVISSLDNLSTLLTKEYVAGLVQYTGQLTKVNNAFAYNSNTKNYTGNLGAGLWLILVSGTNEIIYEPMIAGVNVDKDGNYQGGTINAQDPNNEDDALYAKSSPKPEVKKEVNKQTFGKDDVLTFTIYSQIPNYNDRYANNVKYEIIDTLSENLEFVKNTDGKIVATITTGTKEQANESTTLTAALTTENGKEKMTIDASSVAGTKANWGKYIKVVYQAKLTETAKKALTLSATETSNDLSVKYSNDPTDKNSVTEQTDKTYQYTFGIDADVSGSVVSKQFVKISADETITVEGKEEAKKLSGAEFELVVKDEKNSTDENPVYTSAGFEKVTTSSEGLAKFVGLDANKVYYLHETKAPDGYTIDDKYVPVLIKVTEYDETDTANKGKLKKYSIQIGGIVVAEGGNVSLSDEGENKVATGNYSVDNGVITLTGETQYLFKNTTLTNLPSTGGIGTTIFTIGGCAIMIIAAALFFASRRKSAK